MNIFITGATTGIGLELAKMYLDEGHSVGICGRDLSKLPSGICDRYPKLQPFEVDVTDKERLQQTIRTFSRGGIDIIVANAGIALGKKEDIPNFDEAYKMFDVNLNGVLYTFEVGVELMLPKVGGQLVAISSIAGFVGLPGVFAYSTSKAAVATMCESLSISLKKHGIKVTTIMPGFIDTPLTEKNDHLMPFLMSVEKGASKIKRAIDKKREWYAFPWQMHFTVYILSRMPRCMYRFLMGLKFLNYREWQGK